MGSPLGLCCVGESLDLGGGGELLQEAHVVLEIVAEVVHLPLEHGDTLNAHTEGKAGVLFGVDAGGFEHVRIYHAAAHDFEPAGAFADVAALAMADVAADVHLGGRLGEGEVGGTHADFRLRAEHLAGEQQDGLLEVCEGNVLVHIKTLYLMEDAVGAGRYGLVAEHTAGTDDADGKALLLHGANLHRRGVGAQQQRVHMAGAHEEGVLHLAGRVIGREVEGLEHVVIVLDLRAFGHVVAEFTEDVHDLLTHDGNGVTAAQRVSVSGHGEVLLGGIGHSGLLGGGL